MSRAVLNPYRFQVELKELIDSLYRDGARVVEVGCYTGITSFLVDDRFDKTLLDLNQPALGLAEELFRSFQKGGRFVAGDMFGMPFPDGSFDVLFNSGVLEHFDYGERVAALREYRRVLKQDGALVLAFPNHYSVPYRIGYRYLNLLKSWPYPPEFRLRDLREELREAGLEFRERRVLDRATPLHYLRRVALLGLPLKHLFKLVGFEGYLTVITAGKA